MGSRRHFSRLTGAVAGMVSLLFIGVAAAPAQAEPARDQQWHLDAMQAEKMWEVSRGEGITVAVVDTGVDASLPDLKGQVLDGKDFTNLPGGAHDDYQGHGTSMASLIAATGEAGTVRGTLGLAPESKILPLRIYAGGTGAADNAAEGVEMFADTVAPAIRYAAESEAKIINISQGSYPPSHKIAEAVEYALSKGKLIFAGVGNSGDEANLVLYPAAHPGVVGVGAVDREVRATDESQRGPQVDLVAPGMAMVHSCKGGSELCESHGTSDATAIASASAALIWAEHPDWTANQVTRVLMETAGGPDSGKERTDQVGYGAVRPRIALLEGPVDPGDPNTSPLPASPYYEGNASTSQKPSTGSGEAKAQAPDDQAAVPTGDATSGLSTGEWIVYGLLAAAILAGAIATPVLLSHRKRSRTAPPDPQFAKPPTPSAPPGPWPNQPNQRQNTTGR